MENSMEVPQKTKNRTTIRPSIPTTGHIPWENHNSKRIMYRASPVAQWLRIRLPMQGTRVQALVWEDPTCHVATKPMHRNYWACALEPTCHNYWAVCHKYWSPRTQSPCSTIREATEMRRLCAATKSSPRSLQPEKARAQQQRPNAAKIKNK